MTRAHLLIPLLAAAIGCATLSTGCAERDGNVQARSTVTSATDSRLELVQAKAEIGKAITDLQLIGNQGELKQAYVAFSDDLAAVQSREKRVKSERERMEADSQAYITRWQADAAQFSNDDLRRSSIERQASVKKRFAEVTAGYRDLEAQYRPFITNMSELQKSLSSDLTPAAVESVKPVITTTVADGGKVQAQIDVVTGQLDGLVSSLKTGAPDAAK